MKKLFALLIAVLFSTLLSAQIAYSPLVDSLKNEVTEVSVSDLLEKLSGEVPVWIGGVQYTLVSRHSNSSFNPLAAQNEDATMVATLPGGGKGINPPGTIQPESFLTYIIADIYSMLACSNTVPKPIVDLQNLYDTIHIAHEGILLDLNVEFDATHTYDGDLMIYLISPGGTEIKLCVGNGGAGQNFIGTIFDDEAEIPISEGSAPFTGNYRPDEPLSTYDDLSMTGDWILRIYDYAMNDQGTLNNWCLNLYYSGDPVYIAKLEQRDVTLYQNYPNPFRDETTFAFDLPAASNVRISIIDMMGRGLITVTDRHYVAGSHNIGWNASDLQQGQYFYRIQTDRYIDVKSMMIVK